MTRGHGGSLLPYRVRDFHSLFLASFPGAQPDSVMVSRRYRALTQLIPICVMVTEMVWFASSDKAPKRLLSWVLQNRVEKLRKKHLPESGSGLHIGIKISSQV